MLAQIDRRRTRHQVAAPEAVDQLRPPRSPESLERWPALLATEVTMPGENPLLNKKQAGAYCNCTYPTLRSAMIAGELAPGRLIGNRVCWLKSELDRFIETRPRQKFGAAAKAGPA